MVADADAVDRQQAPRAVAPEQERSFRGSFSGYERDRLFYNPDGAAPGFVESGYVFGLDHDHDGRAAAAVDIDGDGDLDLVLLTAQGLRLLENASPPRRFARVRLAARGGAPALGAVVELTAAGVTRRDLVKLTEGFRTQVPLDLHFGLGDATRVDRLQVRWPSGAVDVWRNLPVDRVLRVSEGARRVEGEPLPRWPDGVRPRPGGAPTRSFEAQRLDGGRGPAAGSRPAVVNFWAPWCLPCNVELPQLARLAGRYEGEVDFVGVSVELADLDSVRAMVRKVNAPYAQFLADEDVLRRFFGDRDEVALPSTFVFDRDGRLRRMFRGAITEPDLDALLASFRDEGVRSADLALLAKLAFRAGDFERAAHYYGRLARLEPRDLEEAGVAWAHRQATAQYYVGVSRLRSGRAADAVRELLTARVLLGDDPAVLLQLGLAASADGQLDLAASSLDQAVRLRPRDTAAWLEKARVHRRQGDYGLAEAAYRRVLALHGRHAAARGELADLTTRPPR